MNANSDAVVGSAVKSADRALDILEFCAKRREPVAHAEIAAGLGIPKSSASALLSNLVDRDYLTYDETARGYALGTAVIALASGYLRELDLARLGQEASQALASELAESVALAVLAGRRVQVLARHNWVQPLMYSVHIGDTAPLHASASGKAILAYASPERRATMLSGYRFERSTPATIVHRKALDRALAQARAAGVAIAREELVSGIVTAAAPVFDAHGEVIAALSISIPTARLRPGRLDAVAARLCKHTDQLSRRFGGAPGAKGKR